TITIEGGPSPMNANDASVGTFVGRDAIDSLPVNGRGVMSLVELAPGVVGTPAANGEPGQFSANGQRANTNYFTVDGVSANTSITGAGLPAQFAGNALPAMTAFGSTGNIASMDALEEIHVLTSSFSPQYGRLPGAQVALTTRSGSNEFHASAGYDLRNEALDANDAFANANGLPRAPLRLNQWNATLAGPLYPNRTFFFASYEGVRLLEPYTFPVIVPSLSARAAAPSQMQPVVNAFPAPGVPLANRLLAATIAHFSRPSRLDAASLRIDHALSARIAIFGRFNWAPSRTQSGFSEIEDFRLHSNTFTLGIAATVTPAATNDFRINFWNTTAASSWTQNAAAGGTPLNFTPLLPSPNASGAAFYGLAIGGVGDLYAGTRGESRQNQFNLVDTYSLARGPHALRLGLDYQRLTPARLTPGVSVTNWWPNLSAVLANALPTTATTSADEASALVETLSIFAQDTWAVTPRLNFTYGFRWEITPPPAVREPAAAATGSVNAVSVASPFPVAPLTE